MKEVREERFTKKEVGFNPLPIPKTPPPASGGGEGGERSNERTNVIRAREETATAYVITVPTTRRKTRQSFDIFESAT